MEINAYKIRIVETLEKTIEVMADSEAEALMMTENEYASEKHVLDYNNHKSTIFITE